MRYQLEEELKTHTHGIAGLSDLYRATVDRHSDLKGIMADTELTGGSLRKAFASSYFKFMGTKSCSNTTAAAATIIHAPTVDGRTDWLVRKARIARIGLDHQRVEDLAKNIAATGSIGHRVASHDEMEQISNDQWIGLLKLVVELVCFDINKAKSFEKTNGKLKQCKLSNFK